MLWFKKTPKVPATAAPQYELSDEIKEEIRANIMHQERMIQHMNAVKKYEAQVRAEIRLEQGYICTCDSVSEVDVLLGCEVHDN